MRFFEIASPQTKVFATKRFIKNAAFFSRGYPAVEKTLKDFLQFKVKNPREQYGKKDAPFTGSALTGYNHVHLFHGKVVLVYHADGNALNLYDVVEHNSFERSGVMALAKYIKTAPLEPFKVDTADPERLTKEHTKELEGLLYEIAAQDPHIIKAAVNGQWDDLFDFLWMVLPEELGTEAIFAAYGGEAAFKKKLVSMVKSLGL